MIKVFYKGRSHRTQAFGEYNQETGELTVSKDSIVSETMVVFKGSERLRKLRAENTDENGILINDVVFDSPSPAAAFVAGFSVNGFLAWHVEKHITLREALKKTEGDR